MLRDKTFNIAKNRKHNRRQRGVASMVYKFFDKKKKVLQLLMHFKTFQDNLIAYQTKYGLIKVFTIHQWNNG